MVTSCRDCLTRARERCIQQSSTSLSVKMMMRGAFQAGTDTQWMWGLLQMNCPLGSQDEAGPDSSGALARRLRDAKRAKVAEEPTRAEPSRSPAAAGAGGVPSDFCLVLQGGQHRIALPRNGEIVLGRFDPLVNATPDVDLSFENRKSGDISRRHARIVGRDGTHLIEDVGSTAGTMVNWRKLRIGHKAELNPGDRIILGHCEFVYSAVTEVRISLEVVPQAYLWVTVTGNRFSLPQRGEVVIGRSDRAVGLNPDVDLSQEGNAAQFVARRHARIIVRNNRHHVEDLGSASGTKLNGTHVRIGKLYLLHPGYHLWLGGCVLAYDIESWPDWRSVG